MPQFHLLGYSIQRVLRWHDTFTAASGWAAPPNHYELIQRPVYAYRASHIGD